MGHSKNHQKENWDIAKKISTKQRLQWAINTFQLYKLPWADVLFPVLLQNRIEEILPPENNKMQPSLELHTGKLENSKSNLRTKTRREPTQIISIY